MISCTKVFDKIQRHFLPVLLLVSNLILAFGIELAHDEAYYWLFSKKLAWGYFDHPPAAAWIIALTSWIPGELGVRLGFVILVQLSAWLLASLVEKNNRWFIWFGFNCFPLLAFAGVFAIPDGPLVIASCLWLWSLQKFIENKEIKSIVSISISTAILFYSKYHGVLYIVATVLAMPRLLMDRRFWFAAILGGILFFPHVYWQWEHGFSTFKYHFVDRPKVALGWKQPIEYLLLQMFLPGVFIAPLIWKKLIEQKPQTQFDKCLKLIALFIPAFFFISTLSKKVEANWTVAAGIPLILFLARGNLDWTRNKWFRFLSIISLVLVFASRSLLMMPPELHSIKRAKEFHGWNAWAQEIESKTSDCHLTANRYQTASKLSFYLKKNVPALNIGSRLNQFEYWDWQNDWKNESVCWITDKKLYEGEAIVAPDGEILRIVRGISLSELLSHKTIEL